MIIVARGQVELVRDLRALFGDGMRVIEDRRHEGSLLGRNREEAYPVPLERRSL